MCVQLEKYHYVGLALRASIYELSGTYKIILSERELCLLLLVKCYIKYIP